VAKTKDLDKRRKFFSIHRSSLKYPIHPKKLKRKKEAKMFLKRNTKVFILVAVIWLCGVLYFTTTRPNISEDSSSGNANKVCLSLLTTSYKYFYIAINFACFSLNHHPSIPAFFSCSLSFAIMLRLFRVFSSTHSVLFIHLVDDYE